MLPSEGTPIRRPDQQPCCRAASAPRRAERACGTGRLALELQGPLPSDTPRTACWTGIRTVLISDCAVIFDENLVRAYRTFLDNRRSLRPEAEYREPTEQEWREFQAHFQARKLELGECGRPYGSTCKHEHSCMRCPSLRLTPTARPRLLEIIANLRDRISEAKLNSWLGEVEGLKVSLQAASRKLVSLDRTRDRQPSGPVNLGIPVITDPPP